MDCFWVEVFVVISHTVIIFTFWTLHYWTRFVLIDQLFQFQGICTRGIIPSISEESSRASVLIFEEERMDSKKISIL